MTSTRLCIVRHGETDWNIERRIQGHVDVELNATGREQAAATAHGVVGHEFIALYSSDLMRAMQTAGILGRIAGLEVRPEIDLRERHYGRMQGMTYEDMLMLDPAEAACFRQRDAHHDFGGETLTAFADRVQKNIERLASIHLGLTLLIVTHGGVLDIIYRRATQRDLSSPRDFAVPNAALNWIEIDTEGWRLLAWGCTQHLETTIAQSIE